MSDLAVPIIALAVATPAAFALWRLSLRRAAAREAAARKRRRDRIERLARYSHNDRDDQGWP